MDRDTDMLSRRFLLFSTMINTRRLLDGAPISPMP